MEQKAVIDRIEDRKHAVLLVGDQETEYIIPAEQLPADALPGKWLRIQIKDDVITEIVVDEEETEQMARRVVGKISCLPKRKLHFRSTEEDY